MLGGKKWKKEEDSFRFPNDEEFLGSAMTGGSSGGRFFWGAEGGAVRLFKGWLFALLVSWGLRSSVQQNSPSN